MEGGVMKQDGVIALCSKARQALAQAKSIEDFKDVRDVGEAAIRLAKSRRDVGIQALLEAQEIVRRAERQLGAMLPEVVRKGGDKAKSHDVTLLSDLGIERMQSSRFQKIASVPDDEFESWIEDCRAGGQEMTQAAAIRLAAAGVEQVEHAAMPVHEQLSEAIEKVVSRFVGRLTTKGEFAAVRDCLHELIQFLTDEESQRGIGRSGKKTASASAG
jgi:hypothetical protein